MLLQMYELRHPHIDRLLAIVFANQFLKCEISSECPFLCVFAVHGTFVCVCMSVYLSLCLSVCLSVRPFVCLSVCLFVCLSLCLSVSRSLCLSVCLSIRPSVSLFVCCLSLSGWLAVSLSVCMQCMCVCVYVCICAVYAWKYFLWTNMSACVYSWCFFWFYHVYLCVLLEPTMRFCGFFLPVTFWFL